MGVGKDCLRTDGPFLRNSRSETFNKHVNTLNVPVSLKRSDVAVDFLTSYEQTLFLSDIIATNQPSCCRAATTTRCWLLYD